jgi:uncharacterized protein YoxC
MSLVNQETGQQATPLSTLQARNVERREQTDNALLKEALAISNEKCNSLLKEQNTLIKDLTCKVNDLQADNDWHRKDTGKTVQSAITEMREVTRDERNFKEKISQELSSTIQTSANDVKKYALQKVDESVVTLTEQLKRTTKEIERQRIELQIESGIRKFMFLVTPFLLLLQTAIAIYVLVR